MLYVGLFRVDRAKDLEFWAVLWQGQPPPADFDLVAAYNLLTDLRVIVFRAESLATLRWLDRLNLVGHFEAHPTLDQTEGYRAAFARDLAQFDGFLSARNAPRPAIDGAVDFRRRAMAAPSLWAALRLGRAELEREPGAAGSA
ncbi:MAG TPA: hypothetical protein VKV26_12640 [Dehalococcoidia bacterium]|nr:hypothetical protein [Dehalococcoidia bacterium]